MPLLEVASERGDRIGMGLVKGSNCSHPCSSYLRAKSKLWDDRCPLSKPVAEQLRLDFN
jgi:hypothetical protein